MQTPVTQYFLGWGAVLLLFLTSGKGTGVAASAGEKSMKSARPASAMILAL